LITGLDAKFVTKITKKRYILSAEAGSALGRSKAKHVQSLRDRYNAMRVPRQEVKRQLVQENTKKDGKKAFSTS
jgi:hypothetical protein